MVIDWLIDDHYLRVISQLVQKDPQDLLYYDNICHTSISRDLQFFTPVNERW